MLLSLGTQYNFARRPLPEVESGRGSVPSCIKTFQVDLERLRITQRTPVADMAVGPNQKHRRLVCVISPVQRALTLSLTWCCVSHVNPAD